jgi:hypothetical protein
VISIGLTIMNAPSGLVLFLEQVYQRQKITILVVADLVEILEKIFFNLTAVNRVLVLRQH